MSKNKNKKYEDLPYRKCAGIVLINKENKIWIGHRITPKGGELSLTDKRWQMPQGGIDKGEDALDAAKRELWEETGVTNATFLERSSDWIKYDLPDELLGTALKGKYRGQKMAWFAFKYEGDESDMNISNPPDGAPVEFDAWRWEELHELPNLIVPFKKKLYEQVVDTFAHLVT
ncbi:MAG: RNA pyrophosphohydrolase [Nitratireductor sp.]